VLPKLFDTVFENFDISQPNVLFAFSCLFCRVYYGALVDCYSIYNTIALTTVDVFLLQDWPCKWIIVFATFSYQLSILFTYKVTDQRVIFMFK
jgi:hypothetical protein